ncbi:MAG: hypothetical protein QXV57_04620 [Thermoproteota archaeon]
MSSLSEKSMAKIGFERFIPQIDISDKKSWFWRHRVELPEIFVPLWQLLVNETLLAEVKACMTS